MNEEKALWFQALSKEGPLVAESVEDAHRLDIAVHLPLMALVAYITGDPAGDYDALQRYIMGHTTHVEPLLGHCKSCDENFATSRLTNKTTAPRHCRACGKHLSSLIGCHADDCSIVEQSRGLILNVPKLEKLRTDARKAEVERQTALSESGDEFAMTEKLNESR